MTRLIAGSAGGRVLVTPKGAATRPTSSRAREGLFSTLEALAGFPNARVLDLYAGSGAVGLEALSRGAALVTLVEASPAALVALRANVTTLSLPGAQVRAELVERVLAGPAPAQPYHIVFLDPPYAVDAHPVVAALLVGGWLASSAVLAVERSTRAPAWSWPAPVAALRVRRYGEATLWYGRAP